MLRQTITRADMDRQNERNRYNAQSNYVPAAVADERREAPTIGVGALLTHDDAIHVGQPLAVQHGTYEKTSGMDRSLAWGVRLVPYTIMLLLLTLLLTRLSGGSFLLGFCLFAGGSLCLYGVLDYREHKYSRSGVELHKVDSLVYLKDKEMELNHELKTMVVQSQIEMWRASGEYNRQITVRGGAAEGRVTTKAAAYLTARADEEASSD